MSVHDGHRARLREQFLQHGLSSMNDINALEFLLFYAIPRGDTNPTAHRLLDRFGSLSSVFDAPVEELAAVEGIGENAAALVKLVPQLAQRYHASRVGREAVIDSTQAAGDYLRPFFLSERDEVSYLLCLDTKNKVLGCRLVFRGSINSVDIAPRKLVETALSFNATSAVLAHNHPSGIALPSKADRETTRLVYNAFASVNVELIDHIIVADDDFVSLREDGVIAGIARERADAEKARLVREAEEEDNKNGIQYPRSL